MHSHIRPDTYVVLRLPSGTLKTVQLIPNTIISIGKFGSFPVNLLLGRPFYLTYEILESQDENKERKTRLRVVPPAELNAEILAEDAPASESRGEPTEAADGDGDALEIVADDGTVIMKNNRLTIDDASRQKLTMQEIEELKKADTSSGKEIIAKIMEAHSNLDEKTVFSLAKYTLRKARKYMKRFTVLPIDVGMLTEYLLEQKEASRVMELRQELLGLVTAWSNVHYGGDHQLHSNEDGIGKIGGGRWLVVDETGGLIVAALAEKMGILYPNEDDAPTNGHEEEEDETAEPVAENTTADDIEMTDSKPAPPARSKTSQNRQKGTLATTNTLHILHNNAQPNLSLLKYFSYDLNSPTPSHPLHTHLKPLSWLQLLDPASDMTYTEPEALPDSVLDTLKSGKKGAYYKKRRRWARCASIVDEARAGGFDGLVIASYMDPSSILAHLVPLVRGAGHVVIYSPTVEVLTGVMDLYSRDRKAAFLAALEEGTKIEDMDKEDFPVDPRLLLAPSLQTTRARVHQVLPGRTHPVMSMKGGAEGFVFTARRVLPVEGKVEARGNFAKKRKTA